MDEHDLYIISDDVYNQLVYRKEDAKFLVQDQKYKKQIIYCQSLSKPYAMTGWRIGYMMADQAIIQQAIKYQQYMAAGVAPFIQYGALAALKCDVSDSLATYIKHYKVVSAILDEYKIDYIKAQGAFYVFVNISKTKKKSWDFAHGLLQTKKVAVVPGAAFSEYVDDYVRISFAGDLDQVISGVSLFAHYVKELELQSE